MGFRGHMSQSHWTEAVGASYCESETGSRVSVSQSHRTEAVGVGDSGSQRQVESEILVAKTVG